MKYYPHPITIIITFKRLGEGKGINFYLKSKTKRCKNSLDIIDPEE